jgi:hypothetical protein
MLNFCGIVAAILKMATGRNFSMSGINTGHHYLPTYQILMISDNVEFLRYCGVAILKMVTSKTFFNFSKFSRKRIRIIIIKIKIIIRNGAKTISLPNFVWET